MKKLMWGMALATLALTSACSKTDKTDAADSVDERFKISQALGDSISDIYGTMVGGYILADYQNFTEDHKTDQMKSDLIKGIRLALSEGESEGVVMGMQVGLRMAQELKSMEDNGVPVDREAVLKHFIAAFNGDSVDMSNLRELSGVFGGLQQQVQAVSQAREEARIAESAQAQQNAIAGKAFLDKIAKEEGVQKTPSGLYYRIEAAGDTTTINDRSLVTLNYKGTLIDGTVFDQSRPEQPATFSPAGVIPGFSEGLKLLHKGAKATFYIPGDLAYGLRAPEQIGPNQTLVFEVEIVDVKSR